MTSHDNPLGLDGFEFVEFTGPDPDALAGLFVAMGFTHLANHRSKHVRRRRMTGVTSARRVAAAALLIVLVPLGFQLSVLLLSAIVASLLAALVVWELRAPGAVSAGWAGTAGS